MVEIGKLLENNINTPLVADVHHNGMKIAMEVAKHVDKVRINPGLFVFEKDNNAKRYVFSTKCTLKIEIRKKCITNC